MTHHSLMKTMKDGNEMWYTVAMKEGNIFTINPILFQNTGFPKMCI